MNTTGITTNPTQAAIDHLATQIVSNGYETLGDQVYNEPQWLSLAEVASAVGVALTKPRYEHGPAVNGKVECPLAGDFWDVITEEGVTWCDGCTQELPSPAAAPTTEPPAPAPAPAPVAASASADEPIEVTVMWHERGSYRCREEIDVEDFMRMLRGESPYGGTPDDPREIFTDLAETGTVTDYAARIREAMVDEGRQGGLSKLLEYYFTDNLPDSSSGYVKCIDGSNAVDAVRLTDMAGRGALLCRSGGVGRFRWRAGIWDRAPSQAGTHHRAPAQTVIGRYTLDRVAFHDHHTREGPMTITQGFAPGIAAGGGLIPTPQLRMAVQTAAEALTDLYDGADVQIRFDSNGRSGGAFLITHPADHFMGNSEVGISASLTPAPLDDIVFSAHLSAAAARHGHRIPGDSVTVECHGHRIPGDSVTVECLDAALSLLREKANLDAAALKQTIADQLRDYEAKHVRLGLAVPSRRDDPAYLILAENTLEGREYLERVQRSRSRLGALFSSYVAPARVVIDGAWAEFAPGTPFRVSCRVQWDDAVTPRTGVVFEVRNGSAVAIGEIKARSRS